MGHHKKVLFIIKVGAGYDGYGNYGVYFGKGLLNSARFVVEMLRGEGIDAKLVEVVDNNDIDREVSRFRPDVVIVEALWVVPEKFVVLKHLHPNVTWIVRLHSNIPFLAHDGIAIEWLRGYDELGVLVAVNERRAQDDLQVALGAEVLYLPNFYPLHHKTAIDNHHKTLLKVACYGAIRPLKNQLEQAIAVLRYADAHGRIVHFHINGTRMEQGGEAVRKNLRALFANTPHSLYEDVWMHRHQFLEKLRTMDLGMAVSLSETFCITAADYVSVGIPVVTSPEVRWSSKLFQARPTDGESITQHIKHALQHRSLNVFLNRLGLAQFSSRAKEAWLDA